MTQPPSPLDDDAVEALLRGRVPEGRPDLAALGTLLAAARETGAVAPAPRGELAALLAEGFDPAAPPVPATDVPVWSGAVAGPRGVRGVLRRRAASLAGLSVAVQLLVFGGVAVAGVTTAAGAGALPEPLQRRVATVISVLTPFSVPAPAPAPEPTSDAPARTSTTEPEPDSAPRTATTASTPAAPEPATTTPAPTAVKTPAPSPSPVPSPTPSPTPLPTPTEVPPSETPTPEPTATPSPSVDPTQQPSGGDEAAAPDEPEPGRSGDRGPKVQPATSPEPSLEPAP